MVKSRRFAVELAAQATLALAIGLCVSVVLAGAALLLAGGAPAEPARPGVAPSEAAARA